MLAWWPPYIQIHTTQYTIQFSHDNSSIIKLSVASQQRCYTFCHFRHAAKSYVWPSVTSHSHCVCCSLFISLHIFLFVACVQCSALHLCLLHAHNHYVWFRSACRWNAENSDTNSEGREMVDWIRLVIPLCTQCWMLSNCKFHENKHSIRLSLS
jgi:hypothetical protein